MKWICVYRLQFSTIIFHFNVIQDHRISTGRTSLEIILPNLKFKSQSISSTPNQSGPEAWIGPTHLFSKEIGETPDSLYSFWEQNEIKKSIQNIKIIKASPMIALWLNTKELMFIILKVKLLIKKLQLKKTYLKR